MHSGVDATGIGLEPIPENIFAWSLFFCVFILFGNFFMLNLLVGVVIDNYKNEKNFEHGIIFLTELQREYVLIKAFMLNSKPLIIKDPPEHPIRRKLWHVA
jgi:hypothetical protein